MPAYTIEKQQCDNSSTRLTDEISENELAVSKQADIIAVAKETIHGIKEANEDLRTQLNDERTESTNWQQKIDDLTRQSASVPNLEKTKADLKKKIDEGHEMLKVISLLHPGYFSDTMLIRRKECSRPMQSSNYSSTSDRHGPC
jgi:chromosome segregation ATPase